eukprot:747376-Prorocentrum_minimum.AAC.1
MLLFGTDLTRAGLVAHEGVLGNAGRRFVREGLRQKPLRHHRDEHFAGLVQPTALQLAPHLRLRRHHAVYVSLHMRRQLPPRRLRRQKVAARGRARLEQEALRNSKQGWPIRRVENKCAYYTTYYTIILRIKRRIVRSVLYTRVLRISIGQPRKKVARGRARLGRRYTSVTLTSILFAHASFPRDLPTRSTFSPARNGSPSPAGSPAAAPLAPLPGGSARVARLAAGVGWQERGSSIASAVRVVSSASRFTSRVCKGNQPQIK